jgi:trigger factor
METTINQASPVEYEFEVHATAEELEPKLKEALQAQRSQMDMKGFRKGKVPMDLVKQMHGKAIGYRLAESYVQEAFQNEIEENDEIEPVGQPLLSKLDYEIDGDLNATIRFGVRPEVELADLSDEELSMLDHEVTDEDVNSEVERLQTQRADLMPLDDEEADETDYVDVDLQRIDADTDTPIIGDKEEGMTFFLDDERLRDELREAITGKTAGDTFRVELPPGAPPEAGPDAPTETRLYEVTVNEVKRRDMPELDDAFVEEVTDGEFDNVEDFRDEIRDRLKEAWSDRAREMVQGDILDRMLELHPIPVPDSVVEMYLDSFEEQVKQENDGELPDDFDEQAFRENNREDAERQARWMFIRDAVIDYADLEVSDEDLESFYEDQADEQAGLTVDQLKQFYEQMPQMQERVKQQVLSDKVYDYLIDAFDIQRKSLDEFEDELKEKHERRQALAGGAPAGHGHGHDHAH